MSSGLGHEVIRPPDGDPTRWLLFLHGILGRGLNWRGFARRLVAQAPGWGALLVDLRAHGRSRDLPPPDNLAACADDLARLESELDAPVEGVIGHSFGGKVALAYTAEAPAVRKLFVVDSYPGARPDARGSESVLRVIKLLDTLPARFSNRPAFLAHIREAGFSEGLARWLSQSLDPFEDDEGYEFGLDLDRIRALLDDYFTQDLFEVIDPPRAGLDVHLIAGAESEVYDETALTQARDLASRHLAVSVHLIEGAGHWVHVDEPDRLRALVTENL